MPTTISKRESDAEAIFDSIAAAIRSSLVQASCLSEEAASDVARDLRVWFLRLARRGGSEQIPVKSLRSSLLHAACNYGRTSRAWEVGRSVVDEDLSIGQPEDGAFDLVRHRADET